MQPGAKLRPRLPKSQRPVGVQQGLLHGILCKRVVVQQSPRLPEQRTAVALGDRLEGAGVTGPRELDESFVGLCPKRDPAR